MTESVPVYAPCDGGLVLNSNNFELLNYPGVATKLRNFEVALEGGYRRVKGYEKFGGTSATQPTGGAAHIYGVHPYALGVVVCAGTNVYYTEDGITYTQINKDTGHTGGVVVGSLAALGTLSRANQDHATFVLARGTIDHVTNPYGVLYIATGPNAIAHFHIDGTGGGRTFTYTEVAGPPTNGTCITSFDSHLCVVDTVNAPNTIYYSVTNDFDTFSGASSGSITVPDQIACIKGFREALYIFTRTSIYKLVNINDPTSIAVLPVTTNLGCVSGHTLQEIGGDLIFLSHDGLRTLAATDRISDVELSSLSRQIQPLINDMVSASSTYEFNSCVIRSKSQYRLFAINTSGTSKGICGTLRSKPDGTVGFQWSELKGFPVHSISSALNEDSEEITYHGGIDGYVYLHDSGNSFNGASILAEYESPDTHLGDIGMLHTLHYLNLSLSTESGGATISIQAKFNFNSRQIIQPGVTQISLSDTGLSVYGSTSLYGTATYGGSYEGIHRIPMQGSGNTVKFIYTSNDISSPYTIHGYHLESFPSGRK